MHPHILLVEDNISHSVLLKRAFKQLPFTTRISHVKDGEAALDYLATCGPEAADGNTTPHLMLLDLRLPKMNGLEVLEAIKSSDTWKELPVVILTTSAAEKDIREAYRHHANSYLVKPSDFHQLLALVQEVGTYWFTQTRLPGLDEPPRYRKGQTIPSS